MPVVFSPGEPETRPLDPDSIVYTTAQKVADLLGVGRGEAVAASANTIANAVFVTGADYRDHGFSIGDTILIYSDAFPIGFTADITTIVSGGNNGVQLNVDVTIASTVDLTDLAVADNTYIQNTASFTNGKTRGVTRAIVETRIKETQDRIDNITHNAWRPYLVSAEYLNFDTYKPYRRRYYTDYVGTAPLLFRNVQQILRLEVWQGDDYREIGCAEARLEIVDEAGLSGDSICVGLANGSIATLTVGTGTTNWRADFDTVSTAQNLADLINKEDRVSKTAVEFASTFTLEGSTSNVAVHNEILASANADYGNGKLKLTSMRQTKGGENVSIAMTDVTNMTISQVTTNTVTSHVYSTGILVNNGPGYGATSTNLVLDSGYQAKFAVGDKMYNTNGTELGTVAEYLSTTLVRLAVPGLTTAVVDNEQLYTARMTLAVDATKLNVTDTDLSAFPAAGLLFISNGSTTRVAKYTSKGTTSFSPGNVFGQFSGVTDVANAFIANIGGASGSGASGTTVSQHLFQSDIGAFSDAGGDQARLKDWWLDSEMGIIYFNNSYPFFEWNAVKVSYIYGERYLEQAIQEAATKMVASELLMADDRSVLIPEGAQNVDLGSKIQLWRKEAAEILNRYKEIVVFS